MRLSMGRGLLVLIVLRMWDGCSRQSRLRRTTGLVVPGEQGEAIVCCAYERVHPCNTGRGSRTLGQVHVDHARGGRSATWCGQSTGRSWKEGLTTCLWIHRRMMILAVSKV